MYPIGFTTMASHLESKGYEVRIANIATRMLASARFDPERFVKSLDAKAFGIDLHWMPHVQGAFELAKMVKRHHRNAPVIMGGFSSSYYHKEMIDGHPEVDFVLRGDSTEHTPRAAPGRRLRREEPWTRVPNLTWRDGGRTKVNPLTHVPETLDDIEIDYGLMVRKVLRYRDLEGHLPYKNWKSNPMSIAVSVRGCTHNCVNCAGSCDSFARNFGRREAGVPIPRAARGRHRQGGGVRQGGDIRRRRHTAGWEGVRIEVPRGAEDAGR